MSDDIVVRLRRCGCCDSFEAADEIERLRELLGNSEQLRAERDEARRKICKIESRGTCDPPKYASLMGWDCFKEKP